MEKKLDLVKQLQYIKTNKHIETATKLAKLLCEMDSNIDRLDIKYGTARYQSAMIAKCNDILKKGVFDTASDLFGIADIKSLTALNATVDRILAHNGDIASLVSIGRTVTDAWLYEPNKQFIGKLLVDLVKAHYEIKARATTNPIGTYQNLVADTKAVEDKLDEYVYRGIFDVVDEFFWCAC